MYRLNCLHFELWTRDVHIQLGDVENLSAGPFGFGTKTCWHKTLHGEVENVERALWPPSLEGPRLPSTDVNGESDCLAN